MIYMSHSKLIQFIMKNNMPLSRQGVDLHIDVPLESPLQNI